MADSRNAISRAEVAHRLLKDPIFDEAWDTAERLFVEEWKHSGSIEERERAHAKVAVLAEAKAALRRIISEGEYASREG